MSAVLEVADLSKRFEDREAVRSVSFTVSRGEIFGLLGPNGAGKTTTIGMVSGVVRPTTGSIRILGEDRARTSRSAFRNLGLAPQSIALYPALTAAENLRLFGRLYGVSADRLEGRVEALLDLAGLTARKDDRVERFSGGMKRRLNLACGLVHEPALLLLDEPTVGVDPQSRERIYDAVTRLAREGLALVLTTHYMDEAEKLCHRIAILDEGRIVAEGSQGELRALAGKEPVVEVALTRAPGEELEKKLAEKGTPLDDDRFSFRLHGAGVERFLPELLALVASDGNGVEELRFHRPNLGDVFLHLTGKELRD
jgi:ABC-2 type transport system ATP-binding protein